jgi:hypothetical protein
MTPLLYGYDEENLSKTTKHNKNLFIRKLSKPVAEKIICTDVINHQFSMLFMRHTLHVFYHIEVIFATCIKRSKAIRCPYFLGNILT